MKKIIVLVISIVLLSACSDNKTDNGNIEKTTIVKEKPIFKKNNVEENNNLIYVSASEFRKEIEKGDGILIDLRKPGIVEDGVIGSGTINISFDASDFKEKLNKLDKDEKYLIYCQIGGKSQKTIGIMDELGFTNVTALSDGFSSWFFSGYDTFDFVEEKKEIIINLDKTFEQISILEFKKELENKENILIDVRTPEELIKYGKIRDNQLLIDINNPNFMNNIDILDKTKNYIIYCWHGNRSEVARNYMKSKGFSYAKDLKGGIDAWVDAGESVVK